MCSAFSGPAGVAVRTAWLAKAALLSAALVRLVQVWEWGLGRRVVADARWAMEGIGLARQAGFWMTKVCCIKFLLIGLDRPSSGMRSLGESISLASKR